MAENARLQHVKEFEEQMERVWENPRGWRALSVVNHTTVGLRFIATGGVFFLIGGLLAMLMRSQLALPNQQLFTPEVYSQLFTMHGTIMMFLFAVPILEGMALYLIPKMIGARDLVFPRLSAFGYFCYLFGGIILMSSLFMGIAPNAGWFMYTPLSSTTYSPGPNADFWLLGITFVEISAVSAAVELVVSILRTRAPNMGLQHMPLFCWYILVTAFMIIFGFPPLILASILLELERAAGLPFFDVALGGDPVLWQHLFWLFGHPEVYIIFLPAAGIVSTILPVFSQRPIVGHWWLVLAIITTGFISFGLWVHHMFTIGIPHLAQAFFSVASMLVAIPTAIQVFAWLATLWVGKPVFHVPMLWILGFLIIFVAGGLTGVMLALVPFDWQVHDTHFVVAHMHYVLVGGMLFPLVAGLYYWLPHVSGRMPSGHLSRWGFWLTFLGFNLTFLIMHITGLIGMPRRVYSYEAGLGFDLPNLISSIGGFVMGMGVFATLLDLFLHFRFGNQAQANPWRADTLEWATAMPPRNYNFLTLPDCPSRHPLWEFPDLPQSIADARHGLAEAAHGRRETYGSDIITGQLKETVHLPGNSWLPLITALALALLCISLLIKTYWFALGVSVVSLGLIFLWSWRNGCWAKADARNYDLENAALENARESEAKPPLQYLTLDGPGVWGMAVSLMANATLFLSLVFGWIYLWAVAPEWQVPKAMPVDFWRMLLSALLLTAATTASYWPLRQLRRKKAIAVRSYLLTATVLTAAHCLCLVWVLGTSTLAPRASAHDAVISVFIAYALLHSSVAMIMLLLQYFRLRLDLVGATAPNELLVVWQWCAYSLLVIWIAVLMIFGLPSVWGVP